jgi:MtN3 and saliva related transmembrane protein
MAMSIATMVGLAAALFTTTAFLPQVVRAWRTRSTRDLSYGTFVTYAVGLAMWFAYGMMIRDVPLMLSNGTTLLLALTIIGLKIRHG